MNPIAKFRGSLTRGNSFQPGEKSCDKIVINKDGDLMFVSTGNSVFGYNLLTEVCFREYKGHDGQIYSIDVNERSTMLLSVGASMDIIIHDIETGEILIQYKNDGVIWGCCCFAPGINRIAVVSTKQFKKKPNMCIFHVKLQDKKLELKESIEFDANVNAIVWPNEDSIIVGNDEGKLTLFSCADKSAFECARVVEAHRGAINSITLSFDRKIIATASADTTASTWTIDLDHRANFLHSFLVSAAAISPDGRHIVLASSADKKSVAGTNFGSTDFTINFFHTVFHNEFASMKVHKSPVNDVKFTPDGMTLVTASQEGTFTIIRLGQNYEKMCHKHEEELKALIKEAREGK